MFYVSNGGNRWLAYILFTLSTFAKIIAHVHTRILSIHMALGTCQATFNCAILSVRLLLSFSLLKVTIEYYFILLITQLLIMNLRTNSSGTAHTLLTISYDLLHYNNNILFSINIITPIPQHFCRRSHGLTSLLLITLLCTCGFHQHKCLVYEWVIDVTAFNSLHSRMIVCIHPIVLYCLHPRGKTVVFFDK